MQIHTNEATPLVSIIMPAYNAEAYIAQAIDSVVAQTLVDWELLIIDDCSQDKTAVIAREYMQKDSRVHLLQNEKNIGVARTRNRGLELVRGDYVALLDSDDYWKPQMLEKTVAKARETEADIIYCSYEIVDERGQKLCNDFIVPEKTDFENSIVRSVITCSTVLITQKLALENRFPVNMYHEDIAMWFHILKQGGTACGVTNILAAYRQRQGSRSAGKLTSALRRWPIYRKHLGMSVWKSAITMVQYGFYGLKKFKRI